MAKESRYRIEHVASTPRGWRVRTVRRNPGHQLRVAFPPGARKNGSGRVVEILHPRGENPRGCNPSELLLLGGNPRPTRRRKNQEIVSEAQAEAMRDKAIDFLDRIDADDPNDIHGMSLAEYAEHKGLKIKNPSAKAKAKPGKKARRRNQAGGGLEAAKGLFREFHGKDPEEVRDMALRTEVQKDYTYLGELNGARFLQDDGREVKVNFGGDGIKLAADPKGEQLYCIGGNQNMSSMVEALELDKDKELVSLGRWFCVYYVAAKSLTNFEETEWEHYFGLVDESDELAERAEEEGWSEGEFQAAMKKAMNAVPPLERDLPEALYDRRNQRLLFAGGSYYVEWPGIVG